MALWAWGLALVLAGCGGSNVGAGPGGDILFPEADGVDEAQSFDWGLKEEDAPGEAASSELNEAGEGTGDGLQGDAEFDSTVGDTAPVEAAEEPEAAGPAWHVRIVTPGDGAMVTAAVRVRVEPVEAVELKVDTLTVSLEGVPIFTDTKLPTEFVLDTTAHPQGAWLLEAVATVGAESASHALTIGITNPPFAIREVVADRARVANGDSLSLEVDALLPGLSVSADLSALDSGFTAAAGLMQDAGNGRYTLQYQVTPGNSLADGERAIPVSVGDGTTTLTSPHLRVALANSPQVPIRLDGGIFVPGPLPAASADWMQPISQVGGNDVVITGGSAKVSLDFSGYALAKEIVGVLVAVEGCDGYFQKPLASTGGVEELLLTMRTYATGEAPPAKLTLKLAVRDIRGRVSAVRTRDLTVQAVGGGDVQVSISWDTATDVDLHVIEPGGCELYYANKNCTSGGWLDLDSNPACLIDNVNNENVFWPAGQAPLGDYRVKVDFYSDCGGFFTPGLPAAYTVTLRYCGKLELVPGSFAAGTDDMGSAGSGTLVAEFNNEACARPLKGRVRYQDHAIDRSGSGPRTWRPVRFAQVEVVRASDEAVLATAWTDRDGAYEALFTNDGAPGVRLRVSSTTRQDDGLRRITVMNHPKFKRVYAVDSASLDETLGDDPRLDLDLAEAEGAGAFNILDVVAGGYDTVRLMTGKDLGELVAYWSTGANTTDTLFCSQYFYDQGTCTELNALSVQGKDTDRDEFDDLVILKEFFKFALARCSRDDNPGGYHDGTRDDPRRSWSEGVSTFFPCDVTGTRWFVNGRPQGVYLVTDLEEVNLPFAQGVVPVSMQGDLSELLVSSLLWDLADPAGEESFDSVNGKRLPIYDSVFNYLPGDKFVDRGVPGVDLVDFLDGWFCRAWADDANVLALLQHVQFPYDSSWPLDCFSGQ
jgi:hypothetical protein